MTVGAKMDVFLEKFRRGWGRGSFPIQKITLQILLVSKRYILVVNFGKNVQKGGRGGGVIANPKISLQIYAYLRIFWKKAQCNFQKGTGGGVKAVWQFSKKTSIFGETDVPYISCMHADNAYNAIYCNGHFKTIRADVQCT